MKRLTVRAHCFGLPSGPLALLDEIVLAAPCSGFTRRLGSRRIALPPYRPRQLIYAVRIVCLANTRVLAQPLNPALSIRASDRLLRRVGYRPGMACPNGWWEQGPEYFLWQIRFDCFLMVRECGETNLWTVERLWEERRYVDYDEVLAYEFGSTPIVTRNPHSSMRLAMYCHENGPPKWATLY